MSLGGRDDIYPAVGAYRTPTPAPVGRNRYAEIMSQYGQAQPFSFFGTPSGGFNPYASDYTGGFTPYQRPAPAPALPVEQDQYAEIIRQLGGGGGGEREGPSAWSQMTPAERAAYYRENPTEGSIALGVQDLLGNATLMGQIAKYFGADAFYNSRLEKQGLDPESFAYGPPDPNFSSQAAAAARQEAQIAAVNAANAEGAGLLANPMAQDPAQRAIAADVAETQSLLNRFPAQVKAEAEAPAAETAQQKLDRENFESAAAWQRERDAYLSTLAPTREEGEAIARANAESAAAWQREQDRANYESAVASQKAQTASDLETQNLLNRYPAPTGGGSQRGGESVGGYTGVNTSRATSGQFGMDPSTRGQYAKGGYVSMQHLGGPDPDGPDDGYAALKDGEFVINDRAVKKYGIELMNAINSGKISKGKLRGLLEM